MDRLDVQKEQKGIRKTIGIGLWEFFYKSLTVPIDLCCGWRRGGNF